MKRFKLMLFTLLVTTSIAISAAPQTGPGRMGDSDHMGATMMQCGMMGGPMMIGGMLVMLLIAVLLVLAILSLVKYLRSDRRPAG